MTTATTATVMAHNVAGKRSHMLVALKDVEQLQETHRQIDECNARYRNQLPILRAQVEDIEKRMLLFHSATDIPEYYRLLGEKQRREKRIIDIENQAMVEELKSDVDRVYGYLKTSSQFQTSGDATTAVTLVDSTMPTVLDVVPEGNLSDDEDQVDVEISTATRPLALRKRKLDITVTDEIESLTTTTHNKRIKMDISMQVNVDEQSGCDQQSDQEMIPTEGADDVGTLPNHEKRKRKHELMTPAANEEAREDVQFKRVRTDSDDVNFDPRLSRHAGMMAIVKRRNLLEDVRTTPCYNLRQFCEKCRSPYINSTEESKLICTNCENSISVIDSTPATVAFAAESENQQYSYERFTHLMNKLEPFDARREMTIEQEDEVLDSVKYLYRQNRFFTKGEITFDKMNMFLKFLKYYHLYKAKYAITMKFNKKWWPILTDYEQLKLVLAFLVFQESFENVKKDSRSSYFKYEFSLFHKCNMLDIKRCLPYLRLLETKERHQKQLALLRRIVKMHGWPYNPVM